MFYIYVQINASESESESVIHPGSSRAAGKAQPYSVTGAGDFERGMQKAVVVFLLSTRALGHLINWELLSNQYFTTPSIPKCVAWGHPN